MSARRVLVAVAVAVLFATAAARAQERPSVGVAFGGGGARGLAHVGVIRWLEEHHVPIDIAAGTSMGALVAGFFATGMPAAELETLLAEMDWNTVFASSDFEHKNIRRKDDARSYPSRLEFGLKGGLHAPTSPHSGQQVGLLLNRIAAPYYAIDSFDDLPTPLRMVAVDLLTATTVVLERGPLAAMRASMSVPGIFPPVELDGQVLVDGGALNNLPADVVRATGAGHVIAVNVGNLANARSVSYSTFGLMGATLDAMVRANTRQAMAAADIVINVPVDGFDGRDFRRSQALIEAGYDAAETMRDQLLPLAVGDAEWARWIDHRRTARRPAAIAPAYLTLKGLGNGDARRLSRRLERRLGQPLDPAALADDLGDLTGLDRYELLSWRFADGTSDQVGLEIEASARRYAPPYLMVGLNLENTTSDQFRVSMLARYLRFDLAGSGSELRVDGTAGSDPRVAASLHTPLVGATFVVPHASFSQRTFSVIANDAVVAEYQQTRRDAGVELGVSLGRNSDVRVGGSLGHVVATVHVGNPGLAELRGRTAEAHAAWRLDTHDRATVPTQGLLARASFRRLFDGPVSAGPDPSGRSSKGVSQLSGEANQFWSLGGRHRVFAIAAGGTSFGSNPQIVDRFTLGSPFHLGALNGREPAGNHYGLATAGYLRELFRLPEFLGGPLFAGGWLETGDAFDARRDAAWHTQASAGLVADTLLGPLLLATSYGSGGKWRAYVSIGRMFR